MKLDQAAIKEVVKLQVPQFNKAYCARPGLRYEALKPYCRKLEFVTDGYSTEIEYLAEQIAKSLQHFNPEEDCLILTGTGIVNILIGYFLATKFPDSYLSVAFFQKEVVKYNQVITPADYQFYRFHPKLLLN